MLSEKSAERIQTETLSKIGRRAAYAAPCEVERGMVQYFGKDLNMKQLDKILDEALTWELSDMTLSNRKSGGEIQKVKIRPVIIRDNLVFQAAQYTKTQVFHKIRILKRAR